ncbi:MAG: hypothetical protein MUO97_03945 [Dehalococcoidia bacterium]|nr:hypothetical protein [Dehalococcoidia bacterium]
MNWKLAKRLLEYIWKRIKEDTLEIYYQILSRWKRRTRSKRLNIWVGLLITAVSLAAFYLYWPLFAGMVSNILEVTSPEIPPTISREAITSFIIISTAMGALILWFSRTISSNEEAEDNRRNDVKGLGKLFLFAALFLSLFLLLAPLLPEIRNLSDFYSNTVKFLSLFSFIGGCTSFIAAVILSFFSLWKI